MELSWLETAKEGWWTILSVGHGGVGGESRNKVLFGVMHRQIILYPIWCPERSKGLLAEASLTSADPQRNRLHSFVGG